MVIYAVSSNPVEAANDLSLSLCLSQPLEAVQMLVTNFSEERLAKDDVPRRPNKEPFKHFSKNRMWCRWARETRGNFNWLLEYAMEACMNYERLYKKDHPRAEMITWLLNVGADEIESEDDKITDFPFTMPSDFWDEDIHYSYKCLFYYRKRISSQWASKEEIPDWWPSKEDYWVDKSVTGGIYKPHEVQS